MLLLLAARAEAFCGTFVSNDGSLLANDASQVVIARNSVGTTLTLAMDYQGDLTEFGLLLPVPDVLTADDVSVVDPALIERVDTWSMPREVAYTCDDLVHVSYSFSGCGTTLGCSQEAFKSDGSWDTALADGSVSVEAAFSEAGYDFVVLSAEESAGLLDWLDAEGFSLPAGGEDVLQGYIDAGSLFLAARVSLDAPSGDNWLPPIQLRYDSAVWSLPIRIGTISATGAQEVLIYTLTENGDVGISNYPEIKLEDECMRPDDEDFSAWYAAQLDAAFASEAGWIKEYAWSLTTNCDPCTTTDGGLTPDELTTLGHNGYHGVLTRLRVRYTPEQATQDLSLYESAGLTASSQQRFIRCAKELEYLFPVCGEGMRDHPGTCDLVDRAPVTGCPTGAPFTFAGIVTMATLARRRRS